MLFNTEDMKKDFKTLDAYKKFDVRKKAKVGQYLITLTSYTLFPKATLRT